jgi:transposase
VATLYLAFELGSTKWTVGFTDAPAQRPRIRMIAAGDLRALEREVLGAKMRFGLPREAAVQSCYEAGRDGFWLHRWLLAQGMANVVVDSSSIEVNRKARRAKTDRLDVRKLLALLLRWTAGERKAWSVVHVPSPAAENDRQLTRELEAVRDDRTRIRNRLHGLLATQGVRLAIDRHFETTLAAVQTGDGRPFPPALRERLRREWTQLQIIEARMTTLETARTDALTHWFKRRFAMAGKRTRRIGIVALARKLMIALWRYVEQGVVPEGARLTPTIG